MIKNFIRRLIGDQPIYNDPKKYKRRRKTKLRRFSFYKRDYNRLLKSLDKCRGVSKFFWFQIQDLEKIKNKYEPIIKIDLYKSLEEEFESTKLLYEEHFRTVLRSWPSLTANQHLMKFRHEHTNYDELCSLKIKDEKIVLNKCLNLYLKLYRRIEMYEEESLDFNTLNYQTKHR